MMEKITDNVYRIYFPDVHTCNSYFIKDKRILIDTGVLQIKDGFKNSLPVSPEDVSMVLFTHFHYDHVGCFDLFYSAPMLASQNAIDSLRDNPGGAIHDIETIQHLYEKKFTPKPFPKDKLGDIGFEIIDTPGHAEGSVCILYNDNKTKILFSGDLFFDKDMTVIGRTDLPTSDHKKIMISLRRMSGVKYDVLCPGHGDVSFL